MSDAVSSTLRRKHRGAHGLYRVERVIGGKRYTLLHNLRFADSLNEVISLRETGLDVYWIKQKRGRHPATDATTCEQCQAEQRERK